MTTLARDRRQQAVTFFVQQGWTPEQSSGIVANLEAESGLRPDAVGDGGLAYGIAQWHPDRQANFVGLMGKPIQGSSFEDQLAFVHAELHSTEKRAGEKLAACKTAGESGACVSISYERPADQSGEASKRAAIAERIFAESTQSPAPIEDHGITLPPVTPQEKPMGIAIPLLMQLLPSVLGLFTGRAQAQIAKATASSPEVAGQFMQNMIGMIGNKVGIPVTDNATAIQAVSAITALPPDQKAAAVQDLEDHSLDYLDKLAPLLDKLNTYEREGFAESEASRDAASKRAAVDAAPDQDRLITWSLIGFVGAILVAMAVAMVMLIIYDRPYGEFLALFSGAVGVILGKFGTRVDYRYGSSRGSTAKDVVIAEMAKR